MGRLEEALAAYQTAVAQSPFLNFNIVGQAVVLVELGRSDEARSILQSLAASPRSLSEWIGVHVLLMIENEGGHITGFCRSSH